MVNNSNLIDTIKEQYSDMKGLEFFSHDTLKESKHAYFSRMIESAYLIKPPAEKSEGKYGYKQFHYAFYILDDNMFERELRSVKCSQFITKEADKKSLLIWLDKEFFDHFYHVDSNVIEAGISRSIDMMEFSKYIPQITLSFKTTLAAAACVMDYVFLRGVQTMESPSGAATLGTMLAGITYGLTKPLLNHNRFISSEVQEMFSTSEMSIMEREDQEKYLKYESERYKDVPKPSPLQVILSRFNLVGPNKFNHEIAKELYRDR